MWIDSHCHLNHTKFDGQSPADIIADFKESKIDGCVTINCRISDEFEDILKIAQKHDNVWCSIGTHPHDAGAHEEQAITLEQLIEKATSDPNIVGIGESGLDYFYDNSPRDLQAASFRKHIKACSETGLPLIVHTRDAEEDTYSILKEGTEEGPLTGVMHCFSSSEDLAMKALDLGFYISFSGIVTFKNATELQDIAKKVPADRILVETDAPFLAPTPLRGQTNKPSYVKHTGEFLANLRGEDVETFARQTSENFFRLFTKAQLA